MQVIRRFAAASLFILPALVGCSASPDATPQAMSLLPAGGSSSLFLPPVPAPVASAAYASPQIVQSSFQPAPAFRAVPRPAPFQPAAPLPPAVGSHFTPPSLASFDMKVMSFNLRVPFVLDTFNHWAFRKGLTADT